MVLASLRLVIASMGHHLKSTYFCHTYLSEDEIRSRCILSLDSWADTGFSGKHVYVDEFVEVKSANVTGFIPTLGYIDNLPIAHVFYEFDK